MNLEELRKKYVRSNPIFDDWNIIKKSIHDKIDFPRAKARQVWWCVIGQNIGQEQSCTQGYERPVLVIKTFGNLFWGIPITSSDTEGKKALNPLYFRLEGTEYLNDKDEIKTLVGFLALHQMRVFDMRRLKRRILKIDTLVYDEVVKKLQRLL